MNESSIFLAQLMGSYLVLVGLLVVLRRKFFLHAMKDFLQSRALRFVVPFIELTAGLALVLTHNIWVWGSEVIITIVGWMMIIESLAYLAIPEKKLVKVLSAMNTNGMYLVCGVLCIVLGLYLAGEGFGWNL